MHGPRAGQTLWSYAMLAMLCSVMWRQVHKNRVPELCTILFEKKSQLTKKWRRNAGQAYKNGENSSQQKWQKEGKPQKKSEWTSSPGLELTYVVCIRFKGTGMIHDIPKLLVFRSEWVHIMACTEDTALCRVCMVYANSDSRRNHTYGSHLGWLWIAAQQYSSHKTQSAIFTCIVRTAVCCSFCCTRAGYVLVQKSSDCRIRLVYIAYRRPRWFGRLSACLPKSTSWVQFSPSTHRTRRDFFLHKIWLAESTRAWLSNIRWESTSSGNAEPYAR